MPLILTLCAIILLIILISWVKLDTFISFILVSIALGLASGVKIPEIGIAIQKGIGNTLGDLTLIIGFGAMLGKLVSDSGAAEQITGRMLKVFGQKYLLWGLALSGFIIGIPLFYNAGFIIVIPLIFSVAKITKLPIIYLAIPMLSALSVAHGYLPPHPSPAALASGLKADIGKTLIYGVCIAIPAIALAGPIFGSTLKKYKPILDIEPIKTNDINSKTNPPSISISMFTALLPVFLLISMAFIKPFFPEVKAIQLLAEPFIGMLVSVLVAVYLLGIKQGKNIKQVSKTLEESFKGVAPILLIIAGSGALKQIFIESGTSNYVGQLLLKIDLNPLILGWAIAGFIRVCVGSATVAGLTAVGIILPLMASHTDVSPELMVLAVGSGSLMFSHINDGGFWLFKEYFNLSILDTIKTWSVMETIVSIMGLIGVLVIDILI